MIKNIDIKKIVVSSNASIGKKDFKCFIGYKDGKNVRSSCILLPKMSEYRRNFNETKHVSFLIKDDEFSAKYDEIWDKISNSIKKGFDSEPVDNKKYLKTKIKSYEGKIKTNFHNDKMLK